MNPWVLLIGSCVLFCVGAYTDDTNYILASTVLGILSISVSMKKD